MSSSWGNWLEKGKQFAASIDQQLNESVGLEQPTTTTTTTGSGRDDEALNDAWNDDDAFDLDEETTTNMKNKNMPPTPEQQPKIPNNWSHDEDEEEEIFLDEPQQTTPAEKSQQQEPLFSQPQEQSMMMTTASAESFQEQAEPTVLPEPTVVEMPELPPAVDAMQESPIEKVPEPTVVSMPSEDEKVPEPVEPTVVDMPAEDEQMPKPSEPTAVSMSEPAGVAEPAEPIAGNMPEPSFEEEAKPIVESKLESFVEEPKPDVGVVEKLPEDLPAAEQTGESSPTVAGKAELPPPAAESPPPAAESPPPAAETSPPAASALPVEEEAGWEEEMYVEDEEQQDSLSETSKAPPQVAPVLVEEHFTTSSEAGATSQMEKESPEAPVDFTPNGTKDENDKAAAAALWNEEKQRLQEEHDMAMAMLQSQMDDLQVQLRQREEQLESKMEQFVTMQTMMESEKEELRRKVAETKEEAKKRILKAKERVEAMERRMQDAAAAGNDSGEQQKIIAALREEGQHLAKKQSEMEKAVRAAKGETRELSAALEDETNKKEKALEKIASLEAELKQTKEDLSAARRGESQASKLEADLATAREETQIKAAANLSLEQQVKELKAKTKELTQEVEDARKGAALESEMESKKIKKEHGNLLADLETKLRTSEREAGLREDALRHEVAELRKRWQDAVRRADALSMDVQQSTAPLLRQLESMERQNRARAANWAELETKLRSDLEENVIENEKLVKERSELKATSNRLQRLMKERDEELAFGKSKMEEQAEKLKQLEKKLSEMEAERQKLKEEYNEIEKLANEGVSKVRSDMMKTVVETEERYRSQVQSLEKEFEEEREKRSQLERQVEQMLENTGAIPLPNPEPTRQDKEKKLRSTTGQAEILASTLTGMDSGDEDEMSDDGMDSEQPSFGGGFAAMEQLSQRLKGAMVELEALRKQLTESERIRESLVEELSETRQAREKLPLFEAKVKELAQDNREKELELMGLREDISEVRHLYRMQLNALLEEKAASLEKEAMNGGGDMTSEPAEELPETDEPTASLTLTSEAEEVPGEES